MLTHFLVRTTIILVLSLVIAWTSAGKIVNVLVFLPQAIMPTILGARFFMEALHKTRVEMQFNTTSLFKALQVSCSFVFWFPIYNPTMQLILNKLPLDVGKTNWKWIILAFVGFVSLLGLAVLLCYLIRRSLGGNIF